MVHFASFAQLWKEQGHDVTWILTVPPSSRAEQLLQGQAHTLKPRFRFLFQKALDKQAKFLFRKVCSAILHLRHWKFQLLPHSCGTKHFEDFLQNLNFLKSVKFGQNRMGELSNPTPQVFVTIWRQIIAIQADWAGDRAGGIGFYWEAAWQGLCSSCLVQQARSWHLRKGGKKKKKKILGDT